MKSNSFLFWSMLAFMCAAVIPVSGEEVQPYAIPGRYIVVLKQGHRAAEIMTRHDVKARHVFGHALHGFAGEISADRLETLRQDPRVELIEPELELFSSAQTLATGAKRIGANLSPLAKIDGLDERVNADIAILDTGIAAHPDLNIYTNVSFISGQTTDANGHGTHVAGIAAAIDNGVGTVGVAPGARLWAIKVMDNTGAGTTASVIKGIDFVTQNAGQIEVANLSFGGIGYSSALRLAISNSVAKGVVFVVAAGNDSRDVYGPDGLQNTADDSIPAAYPEVLTVSAMYDLDGIASSDDALASFSNYSRNAVAGNPVTSPGAAIDLAAPGVNIASTYLNGSYATMSGTSMAAPHAAGAAALYIAAHSRATNAAGVYAIRQALINSAQPQTAWVSANTQDPDGNLEGLVYVANIAPALDSPPSVTILSPGTGSTLPAGSAATFTGSATDPETGNCTSSLVWTSSLDGQIGTGGSFSKALSVGNHTITASVTDPAGKNGKATITVAVQSANTAPVVTIATPTSGSSFNSGSSISFTGSATDAQDGSRTASLVWTSSINGQIGTGGSFSKSSLSAGTHTIIATATDTAGATGQASISLTVTSSSTGGTASFSSATAITIPSMGAATPYASTINVSGMSGSISQVTVKLNGFSHTYPDDVDVVLVSPTGQKVVLMSDAGGGTAINNVTLTFSDSASALPDSGQIVSGTFKPTDFVSGDTFPAPAPAGPYATSLSALNGQSPNGTWSLYVVDDEANDQGSIAGGWSLTVTTGQSTTNPPPATLSVAVTTDRTSYVNGNRVNFTARVTSGTNPVSGAATALTLLTASGRQVSFTGTTDGNGYFKPQYKISSSRDGIGTYRATVTSSASGYNSGSGTATFTVTR